MTLGEMNLISKASTIGKLILLRKNSIQCVYCQVFRAIPHNSKCRYGERGAAAAKPKAQIILCAAKVSAAGGGSRPRATFYYHLNRMNSSDKYKAAKAEITTIYHENKGRYGYRRITAELHKRNFLLNHKTVQRLMKELGLVCRVRMKKYRSYKGEVGKIAPNLLNRDFRAEKPNQKWVTDVTEFSLFGEKLYLSPILDLHSSDLVSYTISDRPVLSMVTTMLNEAFAKIPDGTNLILHSDQGWQRSCRAAAAEAVLKPSGGNCAVLP